MPDRGAYNPAIEAAHKPGTIVHAIGQDQPNCILGFVQGCPYTAQDMLNMFPSTFQLISSTKAAVAGNDSSFAVMVDREGGEEGEEGEAGLTIVVHAQVGETTGEVLATEMAPGGVPFAENDVRGVAARADASGRFFVVLFKASPGGNGGEPPEGIKWGVWVLKLDTVTRTIHTTTRWISRVRCDRDKRPVGVRIRGVWVRGRLPLMDVVWVEHNAHESMKGTYYPAIRGLRIPLLWESGGVSIPEPLKTRTVTPLWDIDLRRGGALRRHGACWIGDILIVAHNRELVAFHVRGGGHAMTLPYDSQTFTKGKILDDHTHLFPIVHPNSVVSGTVVGVAWMTGGGNYRAGVYRPFAFEPLTVPPSVNPEARMHIVMETAQRLKGTPSVHMTTKTPDDTIYGVWFPAPMLVATRPYFAALVHHAMGGEMETKPPEGSGSGSKRKRDEGDVITCMARGPDNCLPPAALDAFAEFVFTDDLASTAMTVRECWELFVFANYVGEDRLQSACARMLPDLEASLSDRIHLLVALDIRLLDIYPGGRGIGGSPEDVRRDGGPLHSTFYVAQELLRQVSSSLTGDAGGRGREVVHEWYVEVLSGSVIPPPQKLACRKVFETLLLLTSPSHIHPACMPVVGGPKAKQFGLLEKRSLKDLCCSLWEKKK